MVKRFVICYFMPVFVVFVIVFLHIQSSFALSSNSVKESEKTVSYSKAEYLGQFVTKLDKERKLHGITGFDVSSDGRIAVCEDQFDHIVNVYDSNGRFLYGYKCDFDGAFGIEYQNNTLKVFVLRKDIVISLDSDAKITEIEDFSPTDKNLSYWDVTVKSRTKIKNDITYSMKTKGISFSFTQIEKCDMNNNNAVIVIDYSEKSTFLSIVVIMLFITAIISASIFFIKFISRNIKDKGD